MKISSDAELNIPVFYFITWLWDLHFETIKEFLIYCWFGYI